MSKSVVSQKNKKNRQRIKKSATKTAERFSGLEEFLRTSRLKYINKALRIDKWSAISLLFFYLGIIGIILVIISIFFEIFWIVAWTNVFMIIILCGFVFAKPETRFNYILVIGMFAFLMFIPTSYREAMLSTTLDTNNPRNYVTLDATTGSRFDREIIAYEAKLKPELKEEYTIHDLRGLIVMYSRTYDECHVVFNGYVNSPYDVEYSTRSDLAGYYNWVTNPTYMGEVCQDWVLDWESLLEPYLKSGFTKATVRNLVVTGAKTLAELKGYYNNLDTQYVRILEYYKYMGHKYANEIGTLTEEDVSANQENRQNATAEVEEKYETFDISGFMENVNGLTENPLDDLSGYMTNFMHILNWIVFLAILAYGGGAVADGIKLDVGEAAKKLAFIGMAIAILTLIYSMFTSIDIPLVSVWDTLGDSWTTLMKTIGFATMDTSGNDIVTANGVADGAYRMMPIMMPFILIGMAFGFRKSDLNSIMFAKAVSDEDTIEVSATSFSISTGVILLAMGVYIVGYFLVTAEPSIVVNPFITIGFYIFAVVTLLLIGNKFLIVSKEKDLRTFLFRTVKWTLFGLMGLFMWFGVFQPAMMQLNLTNAQNSLLVLSQGQTIFETDFMQQLFLVAAPETLIFQIFFIGIGNRIYFYLRKTKISRETLKLMREERWSLAVQFKSIKIDPNSDSRKNVRNIAKAMVLKQKIEDIREQLEEKKITKVPLGFFVMSTIISGAIGSFFFSWYHSFRRDMSFIEWWQNPAYGMTYFGAGFFLCLIAFFSFPASIITHALNNIIAIFMMGG